MIDNYDALTLGRYMKVNAVLDGPGDELEKQVEILAILADLSTDEVLALPLADYAAMAKQSAFLREPCPPVEITEDYRFQGLAPTADFRKITTAQYIDFQTFAKEFPKSLPQLLSVFLIPEGHTYNTGYDIAKVHRQADDLPFPEAMGLAAFFFGRFLQLTEDSLTSWAEAVRTEKEPWKAKAMEARIAEVLALLQSAGVGLQM